MAKAMTQQGFLTQPQRTELSTFPEHINSEELIKYFCLTEKDIALIPVKSPSYSKLTPGRDSCKWGILSLSNAYED